MNSGAFGTFLAILCLAGMAKAHDIERRQATLQLDGDNNYLYSGLILIPIVLVILILDFAIFGTFASRSDELNPVSRFFFHARNGLQNIRNRHRSNLAPYYQRHQRHNYGLTDSDRLNQQFIQTKVCFQMSPTTLILISPITGFQIGKF